MYNKVLALIIVIGASLSAHLPAGPDPIEWAEREEARELQQQQSQVSRRQVPWYLPVITIPQVVEVHHVILLQSPDARCYPRMPFPPPTRPPVTPPTTPGPDDDGLDNRMGEGGSKQQPSKEPSRCVWAIIACCAPGSLNIRYTCFELLGCQGAFWDVNPCNSRVTMAAANTALRYYMMSSNATGTDNINNIASNLA